MSLRAAIVVTGSELVRGDRRDLNGPWLAAELVRLGLEPAEIVIVGDREAELERAIREGMESDLCVCSGGLGPTHDDRTIELIGRVAGRALRVDPELEREIDDVSRANAARLGRTYRVFGPGVRKQASLPEGAVSLGLAGTAPGVLLEHAGGRIAIALPGPPNELKRLWANALESEPVRRLLARLPPRRRRVLRFFGPSESAVAEAFTAAGGDGDGLEATICARDYEIHVDLVTEEGAEARGDALAAALRAAFPEQLFAEDERSVAELVLAACRERGWTLATAESCTGGLVGARLTDPAGASDVFLGGVVAYANGTKVQELGVPEEVLAAHGAVSGETAAAMAAGARAALGADVAVSVTGIAGPGGGTEEKPVGLVHLHASSPDGEEARRVVLRGDRDTIRARAAVLALHLVRTLLTRNGAPPA